MTTNELDGPGLQLIAVQVTDSGELTATATKVPPTATLTNTPVNPFVAMGSAALTVHENTGSVAVIVKLNTPVAQSVTVNYVLTAAAAAAGPKRSLVSRIINRFRGM